MGSDFRDLVLVPSPATQAAKCRGLRTHLVALVAAALLPAFAVGAIAVAAAVDNYRRAFEHRLESTARALASAVDTEIAGSLLALSTLATARTLDDPADLAAFHERARRAAAILGTRTFSNKSSACPCGASSKPKTGSMRLMVRPGVSRGTRTIDCCRYLSGLSGAVLPMTMKMAQRGSPAPDDHHLRPLMT